MAGTFGLLYGFDYYYGAVFTDSLFTAFPENETGMFNYALQASNYFYLFINERPGTVPIYRYYDNTNDTADHFLTTSSSTPPGYVFEGIVGWGFTSSGSNRVAIYRWYRPDHADHLNTTSPSAPDGYIFEAIEWYSPIVVNGCSDPLANNYNSDVNQTSSGCTYSLPIVSFSASPTSIISGGTSTLSWNVTGSYISSVSINQGIGSVATSGTRSVSPTSTTTYTITATGAGGTTIETATLTVYPLPTITSFYASPNPQTSALGGVPNSTTQLYWSSTNTSSASINQSVGSVTTSGSTTIDTGLQSVAGSNSPATKSYILTVVGFGGSTVSSVPLTVSVYNDNTPNDFSLPNQNNVEPSTAITVSSIISGIDMATNVIGGPDVQVSTNNSSFFSSTTITNNQILYARVTSLPFNTNPSGLTNPKEFYVDVGPLRRYFTVTTRAPNVEITSFTATPNPQTSGIDGIPNFNTTLNWSSSKGTKPINYIINGVPVGTVTSLSVNDLPQSVVGSNSPAIKTYTLVAFDAFTSNTSTVTVSVYNDNTSNNFIIPDQNNVEPNTTITLSTTITGIDMVTNIIGGPSVLVSTDNLNFASSATITNNQTLYVKVTSLPFNADPSGLTNSREFYVDVGTFRESFTVTTRAPNVEITSFTANPIIQTSGIDGIPNYDSLLSWSSSKGTAPINYTINGVSVGTATNLNVNDLPQSVAGLNSPATKTYTLVAFDAFTSDTSTITLSAYNDNVPINFIVPDQNNVEPSTPYVIPVNITGIDIVTNVIGGPDVQVSTNNSSFFSSTTITNNQTLYVKVTSLPFNADPSGLTNSREFYVDVGTFRESFTVTTRAPNVEITSFTATPNPQTSGIDGIPNFNTTLNWSSSKGTKPINYIINGVPVGTVTSLSVNDLPQSVVGSNSPAIKTYTLVATEPYSTDTSIIDVSVYNDNTPNNFIISDQNNVEPNITITLSALITGIDMITSVNSGPDMQVSTDNLSFSSNTTITNNQTLYVKVTSLAFNQDPSGLTNTKSFYVDVGTFRESFTVTTRAPDVNETFNLPNEIDRVPYPDIDTIDEPVEEFIVSDTVNVDDIELVNPSGVEIRTSNGNTQVRIKRQGASSFSGWTDVRQIL